MTNQIPEKYDNFAILIHWLMVILIFIMFGLGWYMVDLPKGSDERTWFFALHKSIGLTLALLVIVRTAWRISHKPPALPETIEAWKRKTANITHNLLYILMFLQPVSGYISSSFSGYKTRFWGYPLPHWGWKNQELNEFFTEIHEISSVLLLGFIILHIAGAVSHIAHSEKEIIGRILPEKSKKIRG